TERPPPSGNVFRSARAFSISSIASGSIVSQRAPSSPRAIARSVAWPFPVQASELKSSAVTRTAKGSLARTLARKRSAAIIGPMVCELDGPIPTLKSSKAPVKTNLGLLRRLICRKGPGRSRDLLRVDLPGAAKPIHAFFDHLGGADKGKPQ